MNKLSKFSLLTLAFLLCSVFVFAQKAVTGVVTSSDGEALIGVTVTVKGQPGVGTTTDVNGAYSLNVAEDAVLVFSYTGSQTKEIAANESGVVNVMLQDAAVSLEQVVVVGYGTLTKKQVTGSIAQIKGSDLKKQPLLTPVQGVQGLAAGIQVIGSGQPGSQPRVQIRGINTILTNENPLYVVDGVITDNITNINGNDVFSIDVLKDGAAAIYGTRAANGVILITTNRGREGKMSVSLDSYVGFRKLINQVDMANAALYAKYSNEARIYDKQQPLYPDVLNLPPYDTDWFKEITQNGMVQSYNMNLSGGTQNLTYLFSAGYFSDEGVLRGAEFDRITLRNNNEYRISKRIRLGNVLNANIIKSDNKPTGAFTDAYRMAPTVPVRDPLTGNYGFLQQLSVANPVATLELANNLGKGNRFQGNLYGEVDVIKNLTFRSSWGFDKSENGNLNYTPVYKYGNANNPVSELTVYNGTNFYWVWDNTLRYNARIKDNHSLELLVGHTAERDKGRSNTIRAANVPADENLWYISQGNPATVAVTGDNGYLLRRESVFGRVNYSLMDKYNLSATLRRDGSSAFPRSEQWGTFYSIGASWVISEENFIKNNSRIDFLKLRGGYALLGNDNISRIVNNELSQLLSVSQTNPYGFPNGLVAGITINQLKDATATWEETKSYDAGLEFGVFERITGEIAYYNKLTSAYIRVPTPAVVDPDGILSKAADVRNQGIELGLKWSDYSRENFGYFLGFNATFNDNNVEEVRGGINLKEGGLGNGEVTTSTVEGQPIGSFWVYQTDGIYQDSASIADSPHFTGTQPGDFRYKDVNNDGVLDERDRVFVGSYQPKVFYGISAGVTWKNLDLSIDCYGNAGNKVYNGKKGVRLGNDNIEQSRDDRWRDYSPSNSEPRASNSIPKPSTYFVESGTFFRINNITLGYTLSGKGLARAGLSKARFFVTTQNPVIFKKFSGFTPELPGSNALNSGIELGIYPSLATYMVGVSLNFN